VAQRSWRGLIKFILTLAIVIGIVHCAIPGGTIDYALPVKSPQTAQFRFIWKEKPARVVRFDPTWTETEKGVLFSAFYEWQKSTKGFVEVYAPGEHDFDAKPLLVFKKRAMDPLVQEMDTSEKTVLGWGFEGINESIIIIVYDRIKNDNDLYVVGMHEFGHVLGLEHSMMKGLSVMFPFINDGSTCISLFDLLDLCRVYGCNAVRMDPCALNK
jgi:hypothetical protein